MVAPIRCMWSFRRLNGLSVAKTRFAPPFALKLVTLIISTRKYANKDITLCIIAKAIINCARSGQSPLIVI